MQSIRVKFCALLLSISALGATGCFNDSILSAGSKVLGGQLSLLTADEILVLNQTAADLISQITGVPPTPLTTQQAKAIANFLLVNGINTFEDIELIMAAAELDPESVKGMEELAAAFEGTGYEGSEGEFDPSRLGSLFGNIFGGVDPNGPRGPDGPQPGIGR